MRENDRKSLGGIHRECRWPAKLVSDKMMKVGPYLIHCQYERARMVMTDLTVGASVRIDCPDNVRLHGQVGVVERVEDWGAHVSLPAAASGRFRALHEEMQPINPKGELTVSVEYTGNCCDVCGSISVKRTGSCVTCQDCGNNSGCG